MIYLDLIFNLSLLVTLSIVSGFIEKRWERRSRVCALLQGGLFGGAAVLGMLRPLDLGAGLIFDGRSIMISLCALFFGPLAGAVTVAMTVPTRIALGGVGALMGVLVILCSAGIGLLARFRLRPEAAPPSAGRLYLFGLAVHACMIAMMLTLPAEVRAGTFRRIGPPVILMYPLATILAGKILSDQVSAARTMASLRDSESRYRTIFDHGADGIVILDPETASPVVFNNQVCAQLGYSREEFACLKVTDIEFIEGAEEVRAHIRKILETGYDEFETLHRTRQGETRNVHVKVQYVRSGEKPLYHCIWRDITESKRAEAEKEKLRQQLQTAQRMEAVGTLAGGIAHDFNNALTGIIGFGSLLEGRVAADGQAKRDLEEILNCAERAARLTRQLLMFARPQAIEPVDMDLNALTGSLRNLIRKMAGERIEIVCSHEEGIPAVRADRGQMEQVLMNLCLNARDAMPKGGKLFIGTRSEVLDAGYVGWDSHLKKGRYVVLEVADTGIGMDGKTRERVFEPFFTTKGPEKGTGLGLSVVYGIVKQHGGFINLYSEPGRGATFKVYLPAVDALPEVLPATPAEEALRGGTETILLADDEEPIRVLAQRVLSDLGYGVLVARNGVEAVEVFLRSGKVSLAVLDVVMPGKGGREAFNEMRREFPGLKVLFMSGYAGDALSDSSMPDADHPFLQKPFGPTTLARKIRETLDAGAPERTG